MSDDLIPGVSVTHTPEPMTGRLMRTLDRLFVVSVWLVAACFGLLMWLLVIALAIRLVAMAF